jgi:hypothetical protein
MSAQGRMLFVTLFSNVGIFPEKALRSYTRWLSLPALREIISYGWIARAGRPRCQSSFQPPFSQSSQLQPPQLLAVR